MGTKNNPAPFDCYANADPDEPMFVLLARDVTAPNVVRHWARERIATGKNGSIYEPQIAEALQCADAMEEWHAAHAAAVEARP